MAAAKRHQSNGKLFQRLTRHGYNIVRSTVPRYLRITLGMKPSELTRRPKLTEKQWKHYLRFAKDYKYWSAEDWRRGMWFDESLFELYHPPNQHNDCLRASPTKPSQ